MTMVERVARALAWSDMKDRESGSVDGKIEYMRDICTEETILVEERHRAMARAAIEAMRELSPAAQGAGAHQMVTHNHCAGVAMIYAAIIDAALAEEAPATP